MWSNCLIEAIKAKIKDPKHVTIHKFPGKINNNFLIFPHFWWDDGEKGFDFKQEKQLFPNPIWFKGTLRSYPLKTYKKAYESDFIDYVHKQAKKYHVEEAIEALEWHEGPITIEAFSYLVACLDRKKNVKLRILSRNDAIRFMQRRGSRIWRCCDDSAILNLLLNSSFRNEDSKKF